MLTSGRPKEIVSPLILVVLALVIVGVGVWERRARTTADPGSAPAPTGSLDADRQTLEALRRAGADLTKPTHVLFYLYFDSREDAERALASATTPELAGKVEPAATGESWLLLLEGTMVPTETAINATSVRLEALASSLDGEYDGWEAAVQE